MRNETDTSKTERADQTPAHSGGASYGADGHAVLRFGTFFT